MSRSAGFAIECGLQGSIVGAMDGYPVPLGTLDELYNTGREAGYYELDGLAGGRVRIRLVQYILQIHGESLS